MLALAAAVINKTHQAAWACTSPATIVRPITDAVAGIKIMILKRCARTAPVNALGIVTQSMFLRPPLSGLSARPRSPTRRQVLRLPRAKFPSRPLILDESERLLFYLLQCNFPGNRRFSIS